MVQTSHLTCPSFEAFDADFRASPLWHAYQQEVVRHVHVTRDEALALLLAALAALQCRWDTLGDEPLIELRAILHRKVLSTLK